MIFTDWRRFKGWAVLEFFLREDGKVHVKGLTRALRVSPRTAQTYLEFYERNGFLKSERLGNLKLYSLVTNYQTLELKKLYFLALVSERMDGFLKANPHISTLLLYGSHATGEYDKGSDVDLLAISSVKTLDLKKIREIEGEVNKEVKVEIMNFAEWRKLESKKDLFYYSVIKDHVLLGGAKI